MLGALTYSTTSKSWLRICLSSSCAACSQITLQGEAKNETNMSDTVREGTLRDCWPRSRKRASGDREQRSKTGAYSVLSKRTDSTSIVTD